MGSNLKEPRDSKGNTSHHVTLEPGPHLQLFGATYGQRGPTAPRPQACDLSLESMKVGQFSSHPAATFLPLG